MGGWFTYTDVFFLVRASGLERWNILPRFYSGAAVVVAGKASGRRCVPLVNWLGRRLEALLHAGRLCCEKKGGNIRRKQSKGRRCLFMPVPWCCGG